MKKVVRLTESELTSLIKTIIKESDFSVEPHIETQPRERDVRGVFGKKYGAYIPNDVLRYMRKNPKLIFGKLYEIYGDKAYDYLDMASHKTDEIDFGGEVDDNLDMEL